MEKEKTIRGTLLHHLIGSALFGFMGYLLAAVVQNVIDVGITRFSEGVMLTFRRILQPQFNIYTPWAVIGAIGIYFLTAAYKSVEKNKKYRTGKEYGTARFESVKELTAAIADPDENFNRIFSENVRMSLNFKKLRLNGNVLICGGSGTGKTFFEVKPNLMQMPRDCSFIITDPKGEVLRDCGAMLKNNGYNVRVLNLLEMEKSDRYNPFKYLRTDTDVTKLITNLIQNTTPKDASKGDPFWEKAETMFLSALFYYVWLEVDEGERNFGKVMELLTLAKVTDKGDSELDKLFKKVENRPGGENHPAVIQYNKCMRGAGDTVRSIIISANARLAVLQNKEVLRLLEDDDMEIAEIGCGVNMDKKTKTALFCLIPDNDKSYNFLVGMLYTQIFQELYFQADFRYGGALPLHTTFLLDEFANVALPDGFTDLITTMRSRGISSIIIIQNFAQLKELFGDKAWEKIPGNCDSFIYLGGNEQGTWEYVSKQLSKETIDKRSQSQSLGKNGGGSRSFDVLGRELMTPDEVGRIPNEKCIVFIRGHYPVYDNKYNATKHKNYNQLFDGVNNAYVFEPRWKGLEFLYDASVEYYSNIKDEDDPNRLTDVGDISDLMFEMVIKDQDMTAFMEALDLPVNDPAEFDTDLHNDAKDEAGVFPTAARPQRTMRGKSTHEAMLCELHKDFDMLNDLFIMWAGVTEDKADLKRHEDELIHINDELNTLASLMDTPDFTFQMGKAQGLIHSQRLTLQKLLSDKGGGVFV